MSLSKSEQQQALIELGRSLRAAGYTFATVTPATQRSVLARDDRAGRDLRDVFGWSRHFAADALPPDILALARAARVLVEDGAWLKSTVRFASLGAHLFVHSAFPTEQKNAVFFGPDTHRFCAYVARSLRRTGRVVDVGCGGGAGGILASHLAQSVVLADINSTALSFARVNAALAGTAVELAESDVLSSISGPIDAVIANPPYLRDSQHRTYRDGGGALGEGLSIRIVRESLPRLRPGGQLVVYTGAPIVAGRDICRDLVEAICRDAHADLSYQELDPDVFGEQLLEPGYEQVERIAAVGFTVSLS